MIHAPFRNVLLAVALGFVAAGCWASSSSISSTVAAAPARLEATKPLHSAASKSLLFVSTGRQNLIQIYSAHAPHRLVGQVTDGLVGPNGEAIDTAGNL